MYMHVLLRRLGVYAFQLFQEHEREGRGWEHTPPSWHPSFEQHRYPLLPQRVRDDLTRDLLHQQ